MGCDLGQPPSERRWTAGVTQRTTSWRTQAEPFMAALARRVSPSPRHRVPRSPARPLRPPRDGRARRRDRARCPVHRVGGSCARPAHLRAQGRPAADDPGVRSTSRPTAFLATTAVGARFVRLRCEHAHWRAGNRDWVFLTARAHGPALAHELCHHFGLRHDPRGGTLMTPPGGGVGRAGGVDGTLHLGQTGAAPWNRSAP
jgi:hypothetical protein